MNQDFERIVDIEEDIEYTIPEKMFGGKSQRYEPGNGNWRKLKGVYKLVRGALAVWGLIVAVAILTSPVPVVIGG